MVDRPSTEVRALRCGGRLAAGGGGGGIPADGRPRPRPSWAAGQQIRLDRIGRRRRPVARHRAQVDLDDERAAGVHRHPWSGQRRPADRDRRPRPAAGVLLTAQFADPRPGRDAGAAGGARAVAAPARRIVWALRLLTGMAVLAAHQTRVVVAAAVIRDGAVLAARRSYPPELAGRWEFPGGKVALGETDARGAAELAEELGEDLGARRRSGGADRAGHRPGRRGGAAAVRGPRRRRAGRPPDRTTKSAGSRRRVWTTWTGWTPTVGCCRQRSARSAEAQLRTRAAGDAGWAVQVTQRPDCGDRREPSAEPLGVFTSLPCYPAVTQWCAGSAVALQHGPESPAR